MHGQRNEDRQQKWHMWPGPSRRVTIGTEADSACLNYVVKAGRKIGVGDCALFQADDAPFFIGLIKKLSAEKEGNLKLWVNWLYRLGDIKLGKGASFEAAPNEIFYSFHEDEISAAALLHPCKVAFLQKGVELPSSVSSFVCRRVYDIANKCLYWLTDQDYTDEHQAEVEQLLDRTKHEMQTTPTEGPSPRAASALFSLKQETVNVSLSMQGKGKKRPRAEQNLDSSKREKLMKVEDSDAKRECPMKFDDFASIADKCEGLTNVSFIEQLFHVMLQEQNDGVRKLVDIMSRRTLLVSIIAATEKEECLAWFVQLGGLRILKEWLQEAHKGKLEDGSPKRGDTVVEELLLTLIRALGKLPVDLDALKNSRVGKSVNKLRSHRHPEIQKKAKDLVDMWKKLVNAEMKLSDEVKTGASIAWPSRTSDVQSIKMRSSKNSAILKPGTNGSNTTADTKVSLQAMIGCKEHPASVAPKDTLMKCPAGATNETLPVVKEERSCSSSQSQNNSHSWCSGSVKGGGSWKDEVKPVSVTSLGNKNSGTMLRSHNLSTKSHSTVTLTGLQKDSLGKHKGEKLSSVSFPEKGANEGARVEVGNQRLIVRLPNPGRSPSHSVSGGSLVDGSTTTTNKGSPPGALGRHDHTNESFKPTPTVNIGDAKCGKSNGANIEEENDRLCIAMTDDKDCKPVSLEHRPKEVVGNQHQGNVPKKNRSSSNTSSEMPVIDSAQGGIDLLASVAAREVSETGKSVSANPGEEQPASVEGSRDSPRQGRMDSNSIHLKNCKDGIAGEGKNEGVQAECEKVNSFTQESEQSAHSPTKCPPLSSVEKVSGDGALVVATQLVSLGSFVMKDASPPGISGLEGAVCEGEHRESITRDQCESKSECNPAGTQSMGQGMTARSSLSSVDEGFKAAEGAPSSSASMAYAKDVDSLGCYGEDALEVARQVAKEVEQEVETYCKSEVHDTKLVSPSGDIPSRENVHVEATRDEGDTQLEDSKGTVIITEGTQVSASVEIPTESIEAVTEKGTHLSSRLSNLVVSSHHESNEATIQQCVEPAIDVMPAPKEVSDVKENRSANKVKEESSTIANAHMESKSSSTIANAHMESKSSSPDKIHLLSQDSLCESKDVERPVFDLNEGFVADEVLQSTATLPIASSSIPTIPCLDPSSGLAAQTSSLAAPIAVVTATKGAFIPPSNLSWTKGELGWKGSAATSAFRPAEPRRVAETSQPPCDATASTCASIETTSQSGKQPRMLDIDLNIADERALEDSGAISRLPAVTGIELADNSMGASRPELDLNRVDGNDEHMVSSGRAGAPPTAAPRVVLDFDLNDQLGFEEEVPSQHRHLENSGLPVTGRMRQNADLVNVAPWYSAASSMSAALVMPASSSNSRSESSHSVLAPPSSKPVMTMGHALGPFSNDFYRGAAVTSSTVPYTGSIPASFSYAGFPFGAGFPFTSASYTMGSPLNSAASSSPFLTPTPSQLVTAGAVVSPFGRPYVMGGLRDIPGIESNASWVRPSLDLNSGPEVGIDLDTREGSRPSVGLSQLSYQQAAALGGKRKEPESFDPFRSGFKQTAWR